MSATQTEKLIAVLEWAGWKNIKESKHGKFTGRWFDDSQDGRSQIPPLTLDLMHELEKQLTATQQDIFRDELKEKCLKDWLASKKPRVHAVFSDASQRLDALYEVVKGVK